MNTGGQSSDALEHYIRKNEKEGKIKFDRRDKRIYFIIALVATLYVVICLYLVFFQDMITLPDLLIVCTWTTIYPLHILVPALWIRFFDVCLYLKRLKRYGYTVPEDSRVYGKLLARLPREKEAVQKRKINDGVINTVVSAVITAGILWYCIWYRQAYQLEPFYFFNGIGLCIWGFVTFRYALQISDKRYKADVELDETRRTRESLMEALMGIFFLLVLSLAAILCIMELTRAAVKMV